MGKIHAINLILNANSVAYIVKYKHVDGKKTEYIEDIHVVTRHRDTSRDVYHLTSVSDNDMRIYVNEDDISRRIDELTEILGYEIFQ